MDDRRLKTRVKVENYILVHLGMRPCSQTTMPVDLPGADDMASTIDRMMSPKMGLIRGETNPKRKLAAIASLKKEMRAAYDDVVRTSEQYRAHVEWAGTLRLRTQIVDIRPTIQEIYVFKDRRLGGELKRLMMDREKIRKRAYAKASPEMDRVHLAYPEEFDGSWLREMGEILGYPRCCGRCLRFGPRGGSQRGVEGRETVGGGPGGGGGEPNGLLRGIFLPLFTGMRGGPLQGQGVHEPVG